MASLGSRRGGGMELVGRFIPNKYITWIALLGKGKPAIADCGFWIAERGIAWKERGGPLSKIRGFPRSRVKPAQSGGRGRTGVGQGIPRPTNRASASGSATMKSRSHLGERAGLMGLTLAPNDPVLPLGT